MFVKSYIAKEMPEAMERIRKDLGPDAVLLSSRQIKGKGFLGMFGKKLVEVTVAYEPAPGKTIIPERRAERLETPQASDKKPAQGAAQTDGKEKLFSELVRQKSDALLEAAKKPPSERKQAGTAVACPDELYERLLEREVYIGLAKSIAEQTGDIISKYDDDPFEVAENIVVDMIGAPGCIKLKKYRMNILMLLGPTGVGKTTTIVKLAGQFALEQGLKVGFINTDTYRVAAQEQLKTYAEIMELPICTIYAPDEMEQALLTLQDRDVVLIDTAGKCAGDQEYHDEIEAYIRQSGADEVLLAVGASMGYGASREMISHYCFLKDYKLIITKLDEVSAWGSILNIVSLAKRPIAYVTTGQNVPYDIAEPDAKRIAKNLLGSMGL